MGNSLYPFHDKSQKNVHAPQSRKILSLFPQSGKEESSFLQDFIGRPDPVCTTPGNCILYISYSPAIAYIVKLYNHKILHSPLPPPPFSSIPQHSDCMLATPETSDVPGPILRVHACFPPLDICRPLFLMTIYTCRLITPGTRNDPHTVHAF